jgi:hypothetical protein
MNNIEYTFEPSEEGTKEYVQFLVEKGKIDRDKIPSIDVFLNELFNTQLLEKVKR